MALRRLLAMALRALIATSFLAMLQVGFIATGFLATPLALMVLIFVVSPVPRKNVFLREFLSSEVFHILTETVFLQNFLKVSFLIRRRVTPLLATLKVLLRFAARIATDDFMKPLALLAMELRPLTAMALRTPIATACVATLAPSSRPSSR